MIPVSFCSFEIFLYHSGYDTYNVTTRSKAKETGELVPDIHGKDKGIDPHLKPEFQNKGKSLPKGDIPRSQSSQEAKPRSFLAPVKPNQMIARKLINRSIKTLAPRKSAAAALPDETPTASEQLAQPTMSQPTRPDPASYEPVTRPFKGSYSLEPEIDYGTDTGSPDSEQILDPIHTIPLDSDFIVPPSLSKQVDPTKLLHKFLPRQKDIDKLLKHINQKVWRDTHLSCPLKDLKAAYLSSPRFKDIYLYLLQNKVPLSTRATKRLQTAAQNYMILDGLLFKIDTDFQDELNAVLCIPTSKVNVLLEFYHSSIFGGHSGITKCYKTISQRFYCPNLAEHLRAYITGCHTCQLFKKGKTFDRPFQRRINLNVPAMTKLSMDIKTNALL